MNGESQSTNKTQLNKNASQFIPKQKSESNTQNSENSNNFMNQAEYSNMQGGYPLPYIQQFEQTIGFPGYQQMYAGLPPQHFFQNQQPGMFVNQQPGIFANPQQVMYHSPLPMAAPIRTTKLNIAAPPFVSRSLASNVEVVVKSQYYIQEEKEEEEIEPEKEEEVETPVKNILNYLERRRTV